MVDTSFLQGSVFLLKNKRSGTKSVEMEIRIISGAFRDSAVLYANGKTAVFWACTRI